MRFQEDALGYTTLTKHGGHELLFGNRACTCSRGSAVSNVPGSLSCADDLYITQVFTRLLEHAHARLDIELEYHARGQAVQSILIR